MMSEQPFLLLLFNDEDQDLWDRLQTLPPEKRSNIVKQALRMFLNTNNEISHINMKSHKDIENIRMGDTNTSEERINHSLDAPEPIELSLESLFEVSPLETKPDPVQNLLSIIGEEDDEAVICLFREMTETNES